MLELVLAEVFGVILEIKLEFVLLIILGFVLSIVLPFTLVPLGVVFPVLEEIPFLLDGSSAFFHIRSFFVFLLLPRAELSDAHEPELLLDLAILEPICKLILGVAQIHPIVDEFLKLYLCFVDEFERLFEIHDCLLYFLSPPSEVLDFVDGHDRGAQGLVDQVGGLYQGANVAVALVEFLLEELGPVLDLDPVGRIGLLDVLAAFFELGLELGDIPIDALLHPDLVPLDTFVAFGHALVLPELLDHPIDLPKPLPEFIVEQLIRQLDNVGLVGGGSLGVLLELLEQPVLLF